MAEQYKHMEFREMHSVRWDDVMAKYKPSDEYTTQKENDMARLIPKWYKATTRGNRS